MNLQSRDVNMIERNRGRGWLLFLAAVVSLSQDLV